MTAERLKDRNGRTIEVGDRIAFTHIQGHEKVELFGMVMSYAKNERKLRPLELEMWVLDTEGTDGLVPFYQQDMRNVVSYALPAEPTVFTDRNGVEMKIGDLVRWKLHNASWRYARVREFTYNRYNGASEVRLEVVDEPTMIVPRFSAMEIRTYIEVHKE